MGRIAARINVVAEFLQSAPRPDAAATPDKWFPYLARIKAIQGNFSNDLSFVSALMAKSYLCETLDMEPFDVALKPQSAPGLDIDERTREGRRVIAEIKTTVPYGTKDLGAQQKTMFLKDFLKLQQTAADHKFFFVTDERSYDLAVGKYANKLAGAAIVLLPEGKRFDT